MSGGGGVISGDDAGDKVVEELEDLPLTLLVLMDGGGLENLVLAEMVEAIGGESSDKPASSFIAGVIEVT